MTNLDAWNVHTGGDDRPVVLAVDFPISGRPEAGYGDLVKHYSADYQLWESLPPISVDSDNEMSGELWLKRWLDEVKASGRKIHAVSGFCAGCVYATGLAEAISEWQETPELIYFDPEVPHEFYVYWQFHKVMETFYPALTEEEITEARKRGEQAKDRIGGNLTVLGKELLGLFREYGDVGFDRVGLDTDRRRELTASFYRYMSYMVGSHDLAMADEEKLAASWSTATAISSLNPGAGGKLAKREIRLEIPHAELLASQEAATTLNELLA